MTRLEDVARAAGVSASTVSRVISRPGMTASKTRARVERVIADLARGVEDAAREHGYAVFLGNSDEDVDKESRYLDIMRAESVAGVILPPAAGSDGRVQDLLDDGVPVVCVDRRLPGARVDTVVMNNRRGARGDGAPDRARPPPDRFH